MKTNNLDIKTQFKNKVKYKYIIYLIIIISVFLYIVITSWISGTIKEVQLMYPIEKSTNKEASKEFLKAMEYRIYIKELHTFFDYDSFIMAPLLKKLDQHYTKGKELLPENSVEDIVWWVLFYKDIFALVVPPRNDKSLDYENLPYQEFAKIHDEVFERIERYPYGVVNFKLDEIKKFRYQVMDIMVGFYIGDYLIRYEGRTQKERSIKHTNDIQSFHNLQKLMKYLTLSKEKFFETSSRKEDMLLAYMADITSISSRLLKKVILLNKTKSKVLEITPQMCVSKEAYNIKRYGKVLLDSLEKKTPQTKLIFTDLFDFDHSSDYVKTYMMLANKCANLYPEMKNIADRVYRLNNIDKNGVRR